MITVPRVTALGLGTIEKTGYQFLGWNTKADGTGVPYAIGDSFIIKADRVFYAQWSDAIEYDITYNLDGGANDPSNPDIYTVEDPTITLANPTKTGYTFLGWEPTDNIPAGSTGDKTFTAKWEINTFTVQYNANGGTGSQTDPDSPYDYGTEVTALGLGTIEKAGYTFLGWNTKADGTGIPYAIGDSFIIKADRVFYAQWSDAIAYDITYNLDGGTNALSNPDTYTVEDDTITLANPTKTGYTFLGWEPTDNIPAGSTGDKTFTATWEVQTFTVTWENYDGTELEQDAEVPYGTMPSYGGATPEQPATAQYTYTFAGWTPEPDLVTGDITYVARYTETVNNYTVTWENYDGTELEQDVEVPYGTTPSYGGATPERPATAQYTYIFDTWTPAVSPVTGDITYTATYTETVNNYTVTWENYDGTELEQDAEVPYGTTPSYGGATPERPADAQYTYTFDTWTPAVDAVTGDVTYTAAYTETLNQYVVTFVDYDGAVLGTDTVDYGTGAAAPANPTRSGYTFTGWTPDFSNVTGDLTVTAQYSSTAPSAFLVQFVDFDGTLLSAQWVPAGTGATAPAAPTRDGFTFTGWSVPFGSITSAMTVTAQYTPVAAPAAPVVIPEEETPEAAPEAEATPAPTVEATPEPTVEIAEEEVPEAAPGIAWSLLNLILMVATAIMTIVLLVGYFGRKNKEAGGQGYNIRRKGAARLISLIPGIGGIIAFLLTQPLGAANIVFTDMWTWLMVVIFAAQVVVAIFAHKKTEEDRDTQTSARA